MENYFEHEIMTLKREITALKTSMQKSAGVIITQTRSIQVSIPLSLNSAQTVASGEVNFIIQSQNPSLFFCTLNSYYDDVTIASPIIYNTRQLSLNRWVASNGIGVTVTGHGTQGENSDVTTLRNGGSVTLTGVLTVKGTADFSLGRL